MKATAAFGFNDLQLMRKEKVMSIGDKKYLITEPVKETSLELLFRQFLQEKQFLQNISPHTRDLYRRSFEAFAFKPPLTQATINQTIVDMRQRGMSVPTLNAYGRAINVFLNWLHANEYIEQRAKVKRLKCSERLMRSLTDAQIGALLHHRPTTKGEQRLLALLALLVDSGVRINEALSLSRKDIDLENCLVDITGKGGKFRRIPISHECRKVLFRHLRSHKFDLVFCTRDGCKLRYPNIRYDFNGLCGKLGIKGFDGSFHAFRRYYATHAIRHNVSPFIVQRQLGHSSLAMTNRYLKLETADLSRSHVSALQTGGLSR